MERAAYSVQCAACGVREAKGVRVRACVCARSRLEDGKTAEWEELGIARKRGRRGTWPVACGGTTDRRRGTEGVPPRSSGRRGRREEKCNFCCTRARLISPAVSREPIPWVSTRRLRLRGNRYWVPDKRNLRIPRETDEEDGPGGYGIDMYQPRRNVRAAWPLPRGTTWKRKRKSGKRVSWPVVRSSWFVVRGSWLVVVCGSLSVVRRACMCWRRFECPRTRPGCECASMQCAHAREGRIQVAYRGVAAQARWMDGWDQAEAQGTRVR